MNGRAKRFPRVATPWLALLTLLVAAAAEPLSAQRTASDTRSSSAGKSGATSSSGSSSSGGSSSGSSATSSPSSSSTGRTAVRTRQSTPASRAQSRRFNPRRGHDHYFGLGFGYGYGYGGYPGYYYPYYHHPFYWGVPYYVPRRARTEDELGALDLNVRPKKTEVYLDGQYIGTSGQFDGFPGYLWLEGGSYELIFFRPGLATTKRILTVYPGVIVDVRLRLPEGESVDPSELTTYGSEGAMAEVRSAYEKQQQRAAAAPPAGAGAELDTRTPPGRLRLNIAPADASVYLDGRFLGSGSELAQLHAGMVVAAGNHLLEVVRPGYTTERMEFSVKEGAEVELEILLDAG